MGLEPMMMSAWKADAVATEPHPHAQFISLYAHYFFLKNRFLIKGTNDGLLTHQRQSSGSFL